MYTGYLRDARLGSLRREINNWFLGMVEMSFEKAAPVTAAMNKE